METRGRRESSYVAISSLLLSGVFLSLWGSGMVSANDLSMEEAKEKSGSWANWVQDKVTEGLGEVNFAGEKMKTFVGNAADKISDSTSDAIRHKLLQTEEFKDAAGNPFDAYDLNAIPITKDFRSVHLEDVPKNIAETAREKMKDGANKVAGETEKAIEGMKEKVKETYHAAKEKASQSTGDFRAEVKKKLAGEL